MVARVGMPSGATRAAIAVALIAALAGCGDAPRHRHAGPRLGRDASTPSTPAKCARTVLETLSRIARRIYHEGVASERTTIALRTVAGSRPLREAVERGDAPATRTAAEALLGGGRMTNLRVTRAGRVLADVGSPHAVAPLHGTLTGASGAAIASFVTSVWADDGVVAETNGLAQAATVLRANGRNIAGSFPLGASALPARGRVRVKGVAYQYISFPIALYPSGRLREYLFKPVRSTTPLCGATEQDSVVNTLSRVAKIIYEGEAGTRTLPQVRRVQSDPALLRAVASGDPGGTRAAVVQLLNQHIVRLRVSAASRVLSDVGGPFVLAPVRGSLRVGERTVGSFVLSIQDDEGYLRLTRRLVGLKVVMRMAGRAVKNDLGPSPGAIPATGSYRYRGQSYRVFTFTAQAFPSGPLRIQVLVPIPYG